MTSYDLDFENFLDAIIYAPEAAWEALHGRKRETPSIERIKRQGDELRRKKEVCHELNR